MGKPFVEQQLKQEEKVLMGMQQHLAQRYGQFEYETGPVVIRELNRPDTDICSMYIQQGDTLQEQDRFMVTRRGTEEEGYTYQDNYYWYLIRDEYEAEIQQELGELFPQCKVFLALNEDSYMLPDEINGKTTLEQAKEIGLPKPMFWVVISPENMKKDEFLQLQTTLHEKWNVRINDVTLRVFLMDSTEMYLNITRYNMYSVRSQFIGEINNIPLRGASND